MALLECKGLLTCKQCNRYYPIIRGIPIMIPNEFREFKLEQPLIDSWKKHLQGTELVNFRICNSASTNEGNL